MLLYLVVLAAAQAPAAVTAPPANAAPAQAAATAPEKKKKKRVKYECNNTEAMTGSYLIPCQAPDPRDLELQQMNGAAMAAHAPGQDINSSAAPR